MAAAFGLLVTVETLGAVRFKDPQVHVGGGVPGDGDFEVGSRRRAGSAVEAGLSFQLLLPVEANPFQLTKDVGKCRTVIYCLQELRDWFDFELDRGVNRNDTTSFYEGYFRFRRGDTITVKWCAIDQPQFDFWRTLEFELNDQGSPFASPVIIQSNIVGSLGIWGGYAPDYKTVIVPK